MINIPDGIELPRQDRTPTRPMPKILARQMTLGFEQPEQLGGALRMLADLVEREPRSLGEMMRTFADILEAHGEVRITIEAPR